MAEKNAQRTKHSNREDRTFYIFILSFFRVQSILYTHIAIDDLDDTMAEAHHLLNNYLVQLDKESNISGEISQIVYLSLCEIFIAHATITEA